MTKYRRLETPEDELNDSEGMAQQAAPTESADTEDTTYKKRYGDLRRHSQNLMQQKDQEVASLQAQLDSAAKGQIKFPKTDQEIDQWSKKYPDVAKIVDSIAQKRANEAMQEGDKRMESLRQLETKLTKKEAEQALITMQPDFVSIRQDPAFHEWVTLQPQYIQDALYKNNTDALAASRAIDLYKGDQRKSKKGSKSAAQSVGRTSSSTPSSNSRAQFSESQINAMSDKDFDKNEEAIHEAMRNGRFDYDMSGGAR